MAMNLNNLIIGNKYERTYLAELWGYKDYHAIARGVFTPKNDNKIIIFITYEKQSTLVQYGDYYDSQNGLLFMEGENKHTNDKKLIDLENEVYLFYREKHHSAFVYYDRIYPSSWEINTGDIPSKFVFSINKVCSSVYNDICTEENTFGADFSTFYASDEGKKKIKQHICYERNLKNRTRAIEIHGTICTVCGFDFNKVYGEKLSRSYIEIHHINPLAVFEGIVNPDTDLIPVCSNCHRMLHRFRDKTLTIDALKNIINKIL